MIKGYKQPKYPSTNGHNPNFFVNKRNQPFQNAQNLITFKDFEEGKGKQENHAEVHRDALQLNLPLYALSISRSSGTRNPGPSGISQNLQKIKDLHGYNITRLLTYTQELKQHESWG